MPAAATTAVKGTILVLHGFAQNGSGFAIKASGIRKALKKAGYHTVFVDGPLKLTPSDLPFEVKPSETPFEDLNLRGWTYTQPDRFDFQPSLDVVKKAYQDYGPFVGLIGFSQGSGVVGAILNSYNEVVGDDHASDFLKFAVVYSGFKYLQESMKKYYAKKATLPTLHVMGELDTVVSSERSQLLVDHCEGAVVMKHPGGHYVPSTKSLVRSEIAWITKVIAESDKKDTKAESEEDAAAKDKKELDELSAQMANLGKA